MQSFTIKSATTMFLLVALLAGVCITSGCVAYPARVNVGVGAVWVPGHWHHGFWVPGHWRG